MCWIAITVLFASIHGPVAQEMEAKIRFSAAAGIGPEKGIMRRDPSDIIKVDPAPRWRARSKTSWTSGGVDDLYYVWYSKGRVAHGYDATVWYSTSPNGHKWSEKEEAFARGPKGSAVPAHGKAGYDSTFAVGDGSVLSVNVWNELFNHIGFRHGRSMLGIAPHVFVHAIRNDLDMWADLARTHRPVKETKCTLGKTARKNTAPRLADAM